jgi:hypothetical protein
MNTKLIYFYNNEAGSFVSSDEIIIVGTLTDDEKSAIWDSIQTESHGHQFIPSRVGLPHFSPITDNNFGALMDALEKASSEEERQRIDQTDHPWHDLFQLESTDLPWNFKLNAKLFYSEMIRNRFRDR